MYVMAASSSPSPSALSSFLSLFTQSKPPKPSISPNHISVSSDYNNNRGDNNAKTNLALTTSSDIVSVVCPSLGYANTLFFKSGYNVQVIVDENEHEEKLIGRFRREVMRAGVIQECKRRRFHENKQDEVKRKSREAAKRNRRRRTPFTRSPQDRQEGGSKSKKEEDDDDNWDLPAGGDIPN